jgi:molybdopterin molybdotransferase
MISVEQARQTVLAQAAPLPPRELPLADTLGLVLAQNIASDVDSPPHDKSLVDGFALRFADLDQGCGELKIIEEVMAGDVPCRSLQTGQSTRIMTGAPIPPGADTVVMVERATVVEDPPYGRVSIEDRALVAGRNIMRRAASLSRGQQVLTAGRRIRAAEIGLLAEVGRAQVQVVPRPRVAILSTGNELVPADHTPAAGQIRNSNGPMLAAQVTEAGGESLLLGIARDEWDSLRQAIAEGLNANVLILSGGVSAGVLDLVPRALNELGVHQLFHKVNLKPGKPTWFGSREDLEQKTLVFGLPGNPVSSFVCFELFVRPAIKRLAGHSAAPAPLTQSQLLTDFRQRGDRPVYHPAELDLSVSPTTVAPVVWQGSADLLGLTRANALAYFPAGDRTYHAGETIDVWQI